MNYIALLRGINVGGSNKVAMSQLKLMFEELGYTNVSTYINTGNVRFDSDQDKETLTQDIENALKETFGFPVRVLVYTLQEISTIAQAIPLAWQNTTEQKTDVAYLFPEIDSEDILSQLPFNHQYIQVCYVPGALIYNVQRSDYNKSKLNKLIGTTLYRSMTLRNANTARKLGQSIPAKIVKN